jgi:hypothetical protein
MKLRFSAGATKTFKLGQATILYQMEEWDPQYVEIISLRVPRNDRKGGEGRRAMEAFLAEFVDAKHLPAKLTACPLDTKTHFGKLVAFYESLGFEVRCVNGAGYPRMTRKPR